MRHRSSSRSTRPPRWSRSQVYPAAGLGFALLAGIAVLAVESVAGGRTLYGSLWLVIGAMLVLGGWLFGRQEDRLRHMSVTDSLTGLTNRREFERRLLEERARAERHALPLSLLLIDVDLLKAINDHSGHRAGDRALVAVADALRGSCRTIDIPARLGGDEFAILAPSTSARDALQLASRVQASLRSMNAAAETPVSISIGIADLADLASTLGPASIDLLEVADRALYRAKIDGRDRVARFATAEIEGTESASANANASASVSANASASASAVAAAGAERPGQPSLRLVPGGKQ